MAESEAKVEHQKFNSDLLNRSLLSSSPKQRVSALGVCTQCIKDQELDPQALTWLIRLLFETYPIYVDRDSRRAVASCLGQIFASPNALESQILLVELLCTESEKTSLAPGNYFILTEWLGVCLQELTVHVELWSTWWAQLIEALATTLERTIATARLSIKHSAIILTRRAMRCILRHDTLSSHALPSLITLLTKRGASSTAKNSILLGVLAGVSARIDGQKQVFETHKDASFAFIIREIITSKTVLPQHISHGLGDILNHYVTMQDLQTSIVPAMEKALLRAPEVILNNLVTPLINALPASLDMSDILHEHLLKPLLSCIRSGNPSIRSGALQLFQELASRSTSPAILDKIADDLINPLKTNKVPGAEQKVAYAHMLSSLPGSSSLLGRFVHGLTLGVSKEQNDATIEAFVAAIRCQIASAVARNESIPVIAINAFTSGITDKRPNVRKTWSIEFANIIWTAPKHLLHGTILQAFIQPIIQKSSAIIEDVSSNPIVAGQNGLAAAAYAFVAIICGTLRDDPGVPYALLLEQALRWNGKPSFVLDPKVFTKLVRPADQLWAARAVDAVSIAVVQHDCPANISAAWSQVTLYFASNSSLSNQVRKETATLLTATYLRHPDRVSRIITQAIWHWLESISLNDKEAIAVVARSQPSHLSPVLECICPMQSQSSKILNGDRGSENQALLDIEMIDLLVLARDDLLPHVSWIDLCLRMGIDLGSLVSQNIEQAIERIIETPLKKIEPFASVVRQATYHAASDLAFVAPDIAIPLLLKTIRSDLDPPQLTSISLTDAAIFRTPEGTTYIDVLAAKSTPVSDKNVKDYDTLKWEQELRQQLAQARKQTKKLTHDEELKVKAQLAEESKIRNNVAATHSRLQRGIGIIQALATGPPTDPEHWILPAVGMLQQIIDAGAGLIIGDSASSVYLDCAQHVSSRLGSLRKFIGVATLRAMNVSQLSQELTTEPLSDMITRILYRVRFLGEQRPFDVVSLAYMLPLVLLVFQNGGYAGKNIDENDVQLTLSLEFVLSHADAFSNTRLPRKKTLASVLTIMQRFNQHYKLVKECFQALVQSVGPSITHEEAAVLLGACIMPEASVRTASLQAIDSDLDLTDLPYCAEIWIACHDVVPENVEIANTIWEESDMLTSPENALTLLQHLPSKDRQLRQACAEACAEIVQSHPSIFLRLIDQLQEIYLEAAKPRLPEMDRYGIPKKSNLEDLWETRSGVALTFKALIPSFSPEVLVYFIRFLIEKGPLDDRNGVVRDEMINAAISIIAATASTKVEELMKTFEIALETKSATSDQVNEAVVILYGALARHLVVGDTRIPKVVDKLLATLSTPSESVQYAVSNCLPPLVRASADKASDYVEELMNELLQSKRYANQRGAAYGLAGIVKGRGLATLREFRILPSLQNVSTAKKDTSQRQGAFLAYELMSYILGRLFEPYILEIVPQLLAGFGDSSADVRKACLDTSKTCFQTLSPYGVKRILPLLLEALDDQAWRSKKGACDLLGATAYLDPEQLAESLPEIIPPLANVLNDTHKEVRASANRSLQRFGEVISNPEIKSVVPVLLRALSDPTRHTDEALLALMNIQFVHFLDAPSLALVVRILERGLSDRSATKRKAAGIIGNLAHLTDRRDLMTHLPILVAGLRQAMVDPVPETRATACKSLGSLVEKLGEDAFPDLIPSLMAALKSDTGAGDRLGSAQALSEVLAGLGTTRLEETLPSILQNVGSSKAAVREGFMSLFIFLPVCFGNSFSNYLNKVIPSILGGLADEIESIRDTALKAGRLLVKNFAARSIDLLLPELERGLGDDNYRIRLSSIELVGDLLFNLSGITSKQDDDDEEIAAGATEAGQSLLDVLGEEKRNRILSALYICRCDTSGLARAAAINVWKALVATPRTLREIIPTLTQVIIRRLASSNMEQKVIAGNALSELIRKAGEGVLATLLPTLEEGLESPDVESRQGICMALRDLVSSVSPESLEEYEKTLIAVVRKALVDSNSRVRESAAEAFDALQQVLSKRAIDQVLPYLLNLLRSQEDADNALSALLTLLTDTARSNVILPNLLPTLLTSPMSSFNAKAIASLSEVGGPAMTRRLSRVIHAIVDNIVTCKDPSVLEDLEASLDTVLLSVDENDGLHTMMNVVLQLVSHDDHRIRQTADNHLGTFISKHDMDISRYNPEIIRALLNAFDDSDKGVVKAAWSALNELTKRLRKEDMESLVIPTRQVLQNVGVAGSNLSGFELPKGINAVLPIFLQGLMYGTVDQRTQAALAISDVCARASENALRPFVTQITGPLIRVVSERSTEVKMAVLLTLNNLLEKIPTLLKPFLPQLQRTFAKSLADTSSDVLRARAAKALGTLITMTPRIDPLIAELVTGAKATDAGVRNAMLKALYEVVSKAGSSMSEASKISILALTDGGISMNDDAITITVARLLGVLVKVLAREPANGLIRARVLCDANKQSILALNAILVDVPKALTEPFGDVLPNYICQNIIDNNPVVSENAVLAAGKYLLHSSSPPPFDTTKLIFETLASVISPGKLVDTRRLSLVVIRTISRRSNDLVRPHIPILTPLIFACVRDMVIPIKLAAEASFVALFDVVKQDAAIFDKYIHGHEADKLPAGMKRSLADYFKRVVLKLAAQARERNEADCGAAGLGLGDDEVDDEREIWSVGKVDLGESAFAEQ